MENVGNIALLVVLMSVMIFGLLILLIPALPGLVIIWVAILVYAIINGLTWVSGVIFALITILMLIGNLADNVLMGAGARKTGASWLAIGLALFAGVAGSILWPPFGGLLLALAALFLVEFIRLKDWRQAITSTRSMATGCGWAVAARVMIGMIMILLWVLWVAFV